MKIKLQGHEITKDIYKKNRLTGEQLGETVFKEGKILKLNF